MANHPTKQQLKAILAEYNSKRAEIDMFRLQVVTFFEKSTKFHSGELPVVHSVKSRLKDESHLTDKIRRKWSTRRISSSNLLRYVNDLAGVRVLHLYTEQMADIHAGIMNHVAKGFWVFGEKPVAYSWDPETAHYFSSIGLRAKTRDNYYTSVHYVVKPHKNTDLCCEIQVRTLFEEVWGEIDHALNYPCESKYLACREQLRVLAKLASTGTRLVDSIHRIAAIESKKGKGKSEKQTKLMDRKHRQRGKRQLEVQSWAQKS